MTSVPGAARKGRMKLRTLVLGLTVLCMSFVISLTVFIALTVIKNPRHYSQNWFIHPATIYSPFTLHRGSAIQSADLLQVPVYPDAVGIEVSTLSWKAERSSMGVTAAGLALIRFDVDVPVAAVNSWYEANFPKPHLQLRKVQIQSGPANEKWFQKLNVRVHDETTLFEAVDGNRLRGVIAESLGNAGRTRTTLFYYSEAR